MLLSDFDYVLPGELIAQQPLSDRSASRMLLVDRRTGTWEDRSFADLPEFLARGDCLVMNNSRVLPARLLGRRAGVRSLPVGTHNRKRSEHLSGEVEVFLLRPQDQDTRTWEAMVRPGRKIHLGERIRIGDDLEAEVIARSDEGTRTVRLHSTLDPFEAIERYGHVPLPPYIKRAEAPEDRQRYQPVYARQTGSVAAPTAGLHFTPEVIERCQAAGADTAFVTLHVGLGTFQPVHTEHIEQHRLHSEPFEISEASAARIREAKRRVAVGTTSVRVLETFLATGRTTGETSLFIYPGFTFRATGAMLTNFHLPRSSLFILVCAFAGTELMKAAYRHAIEQGYRFYSYGDCMLII